MNVLYLINYAGSAGTEKYVYNLIEAFHGKGINCYFAYNIEGKLSRDLEAMGIGTLRVEMKHPFHVGAAKTIAAYCKENNIDVIHTQYPRENAIALLARKYCKNLKIVYTSHIVIGCSRLWKIINKRITKNNHKVIAVCNKGREVLIENGYPAEKIEVIYNGIAPGNASKGRPGLKSELGVDEEDFVITTLTRYHFLKGVDYLIESIGELKKLTDRKFKLLIVGDGELKDETVALVNKLELNDCVKMLGFRDDANDILGISDVYINSSKSEALSFAILEAMNSSLPIIATNVGGNSDLVSCETDCGILVEYGDSASTANAIYRIMEDDALREKYSQNAFKAVNTVFNQENLIERTREMYL